MNSYKLLGYPANQFPSICMESDGYPCKVLMDIPVKELRTLPPVCRWSLLVELSLITQLMYIFFI